jgi:poly(3-hydroxybutyrate) depolymerase
MKKAFTLFILAVMALGLNAQTIKTLTWGGQERQYIEYVPTTYSETQPAAVMFLLHGMGDTMDNMFQATQMQRVAEEQGWIIICPQALEFNYEIPGMGSQNFGACWNVGSTVVVDFNMYGMPFSFDVNVNGDVDDEGFLMAALEATKDAYNVDQDKVFFAGFSLGGFMSHRMAIQHGDVINAIAAVSGVIGNDLTNFTPVANVNVLQFFGTTDEMITYDGGMISLQSLGMYNLGLPVEETVEFWRSFNQCDETPVVMQYPDTHNDGLNFELYTYLNGNNDSRVAFIKVYNGLHTWYSGSNSDIDYNTEIVKFFNNTMDIDGVEEASSNTLSIYPNPANDVTNVGEDVVYIYDLCGKLVMKGSGSLDVTSLSEGMYFVKSGNDCSKLIINR